MNSVVHFEMPFDDRDRMAKFMSRRSAGAHRSSARTWVITFLPRPPKPTTTVPRKPGAINGGFFPKKPGWPEQQTAIVIAVEDIKESVQKVTKARGEVLGEPMAIPGVGQYVSFRDTEGNRVSMLQPIPRNWHAQNQTKGE